jgi:putative ABC transport system substrate-binding protein
VPNATKIGVLWDVTTGTFQLDAITAAAKTKSLNFMVMQFRNAAELEPAFHRGLADNPEAVVQLGSPLIRQGAPRIAQILLSLRIPAISQFRSYPDGGGLMSYGPDLSHLYRRVSSQVSRVLRGTRPADLPIERPTKFELVINVRAAKALGVRVPDSLLATADEVIE